MNCFALLLVFFAATNLLAQSAVALDWKPAETELLMHFQKLIQIDTSKENEKAAADYIKSVFEKEHIPVTIFAKEYNRPNVVARIKGNGKKKPILLMAHSDVVRVDESKWEIPPFSGSLVDGYVYGRGAVDDKDNLAVNLMTMIMLKRNKIELDRDVIFLAESGEESNPIVGVRFMADQHFSDIDAEYCLAEGGGGNLESGKVPYYRITTTEKRPYRLQLIARGKASHGSIPTQANAIVHLARAIDKVTTWQFPIYIDETTRVFAQRMSEILPKEEADAYQAILRPGTQKKADVYFQKNRPEFAATLRTTISPTIIEGGFQVNVIPSEAKAVLDVRILQNQDEGEIVSALKKVIDDPIVEVKPLVEPQNLRPRSAASAVSSDAFKAIEVAAARIYDTVAVPSTLTGATDMAFLRARGMQCYGIGPVTEKGEIVRGFGPHGDQERVLERELYRFMRFNWDIVTGLAASKAK